MLFTRSPRTVRDWHPVAREETGRVGGSMGEVGFGLKPLLNRSAAANRQHLQICKGIGPR